MLKKTYSGENVPKTKTPATFSKIDQRPTVFETKMKLFGRQSAVVLTNIDLLFFVGLPILCLSGQVIILSVSVADFIS